MQRPAPFPIVLLTALTIGVVGGAADDAQPSRRALWTSGNIRGLPHPPPPCRTERAFPKLTFATPTEIVPVPGFHVLLVADRTGKVLAFRDDADVASADLMIDFGGETVLGLAPHPSFATNRYLYMVRSRERSKTVQVSRFTVDTSGAWRCLPSSEANIFRWPGGGHPGGGVRFGPDGMLYLGTGDGSSRADINDSGQNITDLQGAVLRIDVDRPLRYKRYRVPSDNPFLGTWVARGEIWAYGLRNPWKMSFDRATGELWLGDVGQDAWESVIRVQRGGNYGWSVVEGGHPYRADARPGPTPILAPVIAHPHSECRAVIGGHVYRGSRLPDVVGHYVYGDHETGTIWALNRDTGKLRVLAHTHLKIVGFAEDEAGELLVLDFMGGGVHRLIADARPRHNARFPRRLSETGLFASVKDHAPAPGLIPYTVNSALWSDGALKDRFLALPGDAKIRRDALPSPYTKTPPGWAFPDGTVLVKTFSFDTEPGKRRRVETRLLVLEKEGEDVQNQVWHGYSYAWNDQQTDAELVDDAGLDRRVERPGSAKGSQTWHFPSRSECKMCHSLPMKFVLGVTTLQMNRDVEVDGTRVNQLQMLERLGVFTEPLPATPRELPHLVDYQDTTVDVERRARAYLHANCAHCHTFFGGGNSWFQLQANLNTNDTGVIDGEPTHGTFGLSDARIVVPGAPERSVLWHRMASLGAPRMPPMASSVVDETGTELIGDWIRGMPPQENVLRSRRVLFGGLSLGGLGLILVILVIRKRTATARS